MSVNGSDIPTAAFRYFVDDAQAVAANKRVAEGIDSVNSKNLDNVSKGFQNLTSIVKGFLPVIGAIEIKNFFTSAVDYVDQLGDAAERAQLSVETFSKLQYVAQKSDIEFTELTKAVKTFQIGLSDAAIGQGTLRKGLEDLGLSISNLKGLALEDQLQVIADRFNTLRNDTDRAAVAQDLFGKSGQALIPLLNQGSEGLKALAEQAEQVGAVLDSRASAGIDRLTKSLGGFFSTLKLGVGQGIGNFYADIFGSGSELLETEKRLEGLLQAQQRLQRGIFVAYEDPATALQNINRQIDELTPRLERLRELDRLTKGGGSSSGGPTTRGRGKVDPVQFIDIEAITAMKIQEDPYAAVMRRIIEERQKVDDEWIRLQQDSANDVAAGIKSASAEAFKESTNDFEEELKKRNRLSEEYAKYQFEQEEELQKELLYIRQQGTLAAQSLLTAFGGKFAAVAKVILATEAFMSIKSIFVSTQEAMMKVIAKYGVPWGYAAAAAVAVYGAARIAAVASAVPGVGGAAAPGAPSNPISVQPSSNDNNVDAMPSDANASPRVVQLIVNGSVYSGKESVDWFIGRLQEAVNQNDVVIFNPGSRQARELVGS